MRLRKNVWKKSISLILALMMVIGMVPGVAFATDDTYDSGEAANVDATQASDTSYVAKIGETGYDAFADALTAAFAMTGDVVVEIYDKVTLNDSLNGSYTSIKFVGKDTDAEIYLDVQGYITATGKKVAFEDLTLSKSAGGFITNAGFMNVAFGVYDVAEVTYTDCTFANGAYAGAGKVTFTDCTFKRSHDKYGLWAYGDVDCTVDGCTFADYRGIKMYAEGGAKTVELTVKNTDFSAVDSKPAIVMTYGESVTLKNNTYSSTGVFELDLDGAPNGTTVTSDVAPTCKNDNGACGVLVDGKIYTTVAQAAEVATSGSTVTLLHDSTETVELPEGVTLNKNGFEAAGVTAATPAVPALVTTIATADDLKAFAESVNAGNDYEGKTVTLTADITLSDEWTPIGNGARSSKSYTGNAFKGTFDGGNHTISGLTITSTTGDDAAVGLFGVVDGGTVENLKLENVNVNVSNSDLAGAAIGMMLNGAEADSITVSGSVTGHDGVGGIVGRLVVSGTISNCTNNASVTSAYGGIGGIVGKAYYEDGSNTALFASVTNCVNNGTVAAPMYVGGIVGLARANVTGCVNNGEIEGGTQTGGIVGQLIAAGTISGNENTAKISGKNHLGGIIGDYSQSTAYTYNNVAISNNVNRGELDATEQCAAIMGCNNIDGFTAMTATGNVSYYYVDGLELFGNPEDMVIGEGNEFVVAATYVAEVNGVQYTDLQAAVDAAAAGDTVKLIADVTYANVYADNSKNWNGDVHFELNVAKQIVLDLNGHTIKSTGYSSHSPYAVICVNGKGNLTIQDFSAEKTGAIICSAENTEEGVYTVYNQGALTVSGGTISNTVGGRAIESVTVNNTALTIAEGATVTSTGVAVRVLSQGSTGTQTVAITGGNISGNYALWVPMKNSGGRDVVDLTIQNGTFNGKILFNSYVASADFATDSIKLQGGTFNGDVLFGEQGDTTADSNLIAAMKGNVISGGTFSNDVSAYVADGYELKDNGNGIYGVEAAPVAVAKIGDTTYATLAEAAAAAQSGDEIILLADVTLTEKLTLPAGITLNGNGMSITGAEVWAAGDLTFKGHTKMSVFNAGYSKPTITIGEGACLELTTGRMVIGHGATFNITGNVENAKTADKADLTPSLIAAGASFTGAGVNFNVKNAYLKFKGNYCSSSKSASGTFDFNIENSIWDQVGTKLAFEAQSAAATVYFDLKDSVLTTGSHLVFGVSKGEIVIDNSNVNVGNYKQLENRSTLTIKNGSVVYASVQTSQNAQNPGTVIVDNATYITTGEFSGVTLGTGKLVLKNGANATVPKFGNATVELGAGCTLTTAQNDALSITTDEGYSVVYKDGAYSTIKYLAEVNGTGCTTLAEIVDAVKAFSEAGTEVTVKFFGDAEITDYKAFDYGAGNITFTADKPVTVTLKKDFDFAVSQNITITVEENVTLKVYDNAGGMYVYYGPGLMLKGTVTGGQNWGCLYLAYGKHTVAEVGKIGIGRTQLCWTDLTVYGKVDTNYLLVEDTALKLDGAVVDADYFTDTNNGDLRYDASEITIVNGSMVKSGTFELKHSGSVLTIDVSSKLTANAVKGSGKIVIDAKNFANDITVIESDMSGFTGTIEVINNDRVKYEITEAGVVVKKDLPGSGTEADPYIVGSLEDLMLFFNLVNGGKTYDNEFVKLTANIDLSGGVAVASDEVVANWTPIGTTENPFKGTFDGGNKTISNMVVIGENNVGFFGYADQATIKNLKLNNITVTGVDCVGGIAGQVYSVSTIDKCGVYGSIKIEGQTNVGGIVGKYYTKVTNCTVDGDGTATSYIKGVYVASDLEGDNVGGIMGHCGENNNLSGNKVQDITISGTRKVGGIVGIADQNTDVTGNTVQNVVIKTTATADYANSKLSSMSIGGLIGQYQKAGSSNDGTVIGNTVKKVTFVNANNVTVDIGPIVGGARGGSTGMLAPSTNVTASGNKVYISGITGSTNTYLMPAAVAKIGETMYYLLDDAYNASQDGDTITLLADIETSTKMTVSKAVTIDLGGHIITATGVLFQIMGDVTIDNGTIKMTGVGTETTHGALYVYYANGNPALTLGSKLNVIATDDCAVYVKKGALVSSANISTAGSNYAAIQGHGDNDGTSITINGGSVTSVNTEAIYQPQDGALIINGGSISGTTGIHVKSGSLEITGGTISGTSGSALVIENVDDGGYQAITSVSISGGTFTSANADVVTSTSSGSAAAITGFITGGQFSDVSVIEYLADGYVLGTNSSGYYKVELSNSSYVAIVNGKEYTSLQTAVNDAPVGAVIFIKNDFALNSTVTVPDGKNITIDLNGKTISGTDNNTSGNFYLINNVGTLTIKDSVGGGKITLEAVNNRNWSSSSVVVANNPGGKLTVESGTIEHLGGTDMAYAIDNLTNGKGTYAETVITGGTVKSTYRAVRQFLNGIEAQNILTVNGGTIEGANKSIWMQDPSKNANTGTLTVAATATLNGDVYLTVTEGSTEWPVEVSIDADALAEGSEVLTSNVPAGYAVKEMNGVYGVLSLKGTGTAEDPYLISNVDELILFRDSVNAGKNYAGKYVQLIENIDLTSVENWEPIGNVGYGTDYAPVDASKAFSGTFDGNGKFISNLKIEKILNGGADAEANLGLFGITGEGAVIKDLTLTNVTINTDGRNVGALVAFAYKAALENITVNGNIQIMGGNNVSGVCAMSRYNTVSATNIKVVGNDGSKIVGNNIVGGIFAEIAPNGTEQTFKDLSVANVAISGTSGVGGIVGLLTLGTVENVSVKNVTLTGKTEYQGDAMGRIRLGAVAGLLGSNYATIKSAAVENVTAKNLDGNVVELPIIGANYSGSIGNATEAKIGDTYYATLAIAVSEAQQGDTIVLLENITLTQTVHIKKGDKVTLDLNGKTVDYDPAVWVYGAANSGTALITVDFGGELTIKDTSEDKTGTLDASYNDDSFGLDVYDVYSAVMMTGKGDDPANGTAKLTVESGTLIGYFAAIAGNNDRDNTEITINGGTVKANISEFSTAGIEHPMNGKLTVTGGTIEGMDGISMRSGTLLISGGTIIGNAPVDAFDNDGYWNNDFAACTGNALQIVSRASVNSAFETPTVTITGGTFISANAAPVASYAVTVAEAVTGFIGTDFTGTLKGAEAPADHIAIKDYAFASNGDGTWSLVVAGLTGSGTESAPYLIKTVEDLIFFRDSVNAGETKYNASDVYVALAADIDLAGINWVGIGSINQEHGFMGNFDGNGYKIKNLTITDPVLVGGYAYAGLFSITEGTDENNQNIIKNLTIENVTISTTGHIVAAAVAYPYYTTLDNIKVCGNISITGGDYTAGVVAYTRRCTDASNLTIAGNAGSTVTGRYTVGGVIADIQMNGGLTANYSNFSASGLTVKGENCVGGISGIISGQTLSTCKVENVTLVCSDARVGTVSGALGDPSTITNAAVANVTGASALIGGAYDGGKAVVAKVGNTYYNDLQNAIDNANGVSVEMLAPITVANGETLVIDLKGQTVVGTDNATGSFGLITNRGNLTIKDSAGNGKITLTATNDRDWNAYSSVISNQPGGKLTVESGTIEHLGGTDMAYGIDNLTNGKGTYAETVINGGTVKSTYRAIRQFLNGIEAQNILTVNGGTIEGANKAIWFQDPSKNANTGTLTVGENAVLKGDVYLTVTEGSTEWPVEVSIDADALAEGSKVLTNKNVPEGYVVEETNGVWGVRTATYVAQIGDAKYESVAAALAAAQADGMTDVVITLTGETSRASAIALNDAFNLYTKTEFDSVTIKQADASKVYYIAGLYTGSRTNGGAFVFDGVNIVVTDQYIFEGNVKLTNNSVVKSIAEANCFQYNCTTTVEPGSKLYGVIDDFRGGDVTVDGGKTDGTYNAEPDMQDAILIINWSGDSLTLKNGAYVKVNSANEVGRLTVNVGAELNVYASKLDAWQWIDVSGTVNTDVGSIITTKKITGAGVVAIDATGFTGESVQVIKADMSDFTGTVEVINGEDYKVVVDENGIKLVKVVVELFEISKTNMVMGQNLALMFAFEKSNINDVDLSNYTAKVSIEYKDDRGTVNSTVASTNWTTVKINGIEYWCVTVSNLAAKEMDDNVTVTIYNGDTAISHSKTMSLRQYGEERLAASKETKFKTTIVDMLNYGAEAQKYFNYNASNLANRNISDYQYLATTTVALDKNRTIISDSSNHFIASSVAFKSDIVMMFAINEESAAVSGKITFVNHKNQNVVSTVETFSNVTANGQKAKMFEFTGMVVADIDQVITVEFCDADGNVVLSLTDSLDAYIGRVGETSKMHDLATAFGKFSTSAHAYLHRNDK